MQLFNHNLFVHQLTGSQTDIFTLQLQIPK